MTTALIERPRSGAQPPDLTVEDRAIAALLACIARTGWSKTTFDDVAREAGCSRAKRLLFLSYQVSLLLSQPILLQLYL